MAITTKDSLLQHLQWAIEVEHSTIPPYLCALFSIKDQESPAAQTILSVVIQEMLHVALACNLLNAVGGAPRFDQPTFIPAYPGPMPHHTPQPPLILHLQPCSIELIRNTFMRIEQPEAPGSPPQGDDYQTLGQFYRAIEQGFENLCRQKGEPALFKGQPGRQLTEGYFGASGQLFAVTGLKSAQQALTEIVDQGEGTPQSEFDEEAELAHYYKFKQIAGGIIPLGQVWPMQSDPATAKLPPGPLQALSQLFNDGYGLLLRTLQLVFNPPDNMSYDYRPNLIYNAMLPLMSHIIKPLALLLMQTPIPGAKLTAGPDFAYSAVKQDQIIKNCQALETTYPELAGVSQALHALPWIDLD